MKAFDSFGSEEHVRSLSRRELENLFRYVFKSRDELQEIITQQSGEIFELRRKVARQAKQLKEVQTALERRNRELDGLKAENDRLRELASTMLRCIKARRQKRSVCWEWPAHKQFDELRWDCCITFDANELGVHDG